MLRSTDSPEVDTAKACTWRVVIAREHVIKSEQVLHRIGSRLLSLLSCDVLALYRHIDNLDLGIWLLLLLRGWLLLLLF